MRGGWFVGLEMVLLVLGGDEGIDRVGAPIGFGNFGALNFGEGPVFFVGGVLLDPFAKDGNLLGFERIFV